MDLKLEVGENVSDLTKLFIWVIVFFLIASLAVGVLMIVYFVFFNPVDLSGDFIINYIWRLL